MKLLCDGEFDEVCDSFEIWFAPFVDQDGSLRDQ